MLKNLLLAVLFSFAIMPYAFAEEECPLPEGCGYTSQMTMEILDAEGKVVDRTKWETLVGGGFMSAIKHKYAVLSHIFEWREGEVEPAITRRVLQSMMPEASQ